MMKAAKIIIFIFIIISVIVVGDNIILADDYCAYAQMQNENDASARTINNFSDLAAIASDVNGGKYDGYYGLTINLACDLDIGDDCRSFDSGSGWIPIGTTTYPFKGTFNGNGYSISGLYINRPNSENVGLFGVANANATIENLEVDGTTVGNNYTGGLIGYSQAKIDNCVSCISVSAQNDTLHIGGIAGYNLGKISKSKNYGKVSVGFSTFVGGVTGSNLGTIDLCFNEGEIISSNSVAGGIAGNNAGNIGICMNSGKVVGKASVGGIVGNNQNLINNVFSRCTVESVNGTAGGIVGSNEAVGNVTCCVAVCTVNGMDDIASVCGYNMGVVENSFFDDCISTAPIVNGLAAENSKGLTTRLLVHEDSLINKEKLLPLNVNVDEIWVKRKSVDGKFFYPELKYFYENEVDISTRFSEGICSLPSAEDVELEKSEFDYNGECHYIVVKVNEIYLELGQDYNVRYSDNINSGKHNANIEFSGVYAGIVEKEFCINKSLLEVEWDEDAFYYDGHEHRPKLRIVSGLINNDNIEFEYNAVKSVNVNEYEITAQLSDNSLINRNYELPITIGKYRILQAPLTIGWTDESFVYNGQVQFPKAHVLTGKVEDENISIIYEYFDNINAGEQTIKACLAQTDINANYTLDANPYTYLIEQKPLDLIWDDDALYYNGEAQFPKVKSVIGTVNDDIVELIYSDCSNNINADTDRKYIVSVKLSDIEVNNNYILPGNQHSYVINKTKLVVDWWDTPLIYNGKPQCPNYFIESGIIGKEEIIVEYSDYSANINACEDDVYQIEIALADNLINANYFLSQTVRSYGIRKADFDPNKDVEFDSKVFGYDGVVKSIFIEGVLPYGVSVEYENNGKTDIGQYTVTAIFSIDADNYNPLITKILSATLSIAQMAFYDSKSDITAIKKGDAIYGLTIGIDRLEKTSFNKTGKKLLKAYKSSFSEGTVEYRIPVDKELIQGGNLNVLYKTVSGEIIGADYVIDNNYIVFTVENAVEFAVFTDLNLTWLWVSLGLVSVIIIVVIAVILMRRKKRRRVNKVLESTNLQDGIHSHKVNTENSVNDFPETEHPNSIHSDGAYNTSFYFDGVFCLSYEWFIKSLSFKTVAKQSRICAGDNGAILLKESISRDTIYWQGKRYRVNSKQYDALIERAKEAMRES